MHEPLECQLGVHPMEERSKTKNGNTEWKQRPSRRSFLELTTAMGAFGVTGVTIPAAATDSRDEPEIDRELVEELTVDFHDLSGRSKGLFESTLRGKGRQFEPVESVPSDLQHNEFVRYDDTLYVLATRITGIDEYSIRPRPVDAVGGEA